MIDLGIRDKVSTENYEIKYLNELVPGEEISGEIYIGEMKKREVQKKEVDEFYVIITDHETQLKWICGFTPSYYPENGTIYGEKGGRLYTFIDSLSHILYRSPKDSKDSYSAIFEIFRNSINNNISRITVKAIPSKIPIKKSMAKYVNLEVVSLELKNKGNMIPSTLIDITHEYPQMRMAVTNLKDRGEEVNPETVTQEFKSMLDRKEIKEREYEHGLKEIEKWVKGNYQGK